MIVPRWYSARWRIWSSSFIIEFSLVPSGNEHRMAKQSSAPLAPYFISNHVTRASALQLTGDRNVMTYLNEEIGHCWNCNSKFIVLLTLSIQNFQCQFAGFLNYSGLALMHVKCSSAPELDSSLKCSDSRSCISRAAQRSASLLCSRVRLLILGYQIGS